MNSINVNNPDYLARLLRGLLDELTRNGYIAHAHELYAMLYNAWMSEEDDTYSDLLDRAMDIVAFDLIAREMERNGYRCTIADGHSRWRRC